MSQNTLIRSSGDLDEKHRSKILSAEHVARKYVVHRLENGKIALSVELKKFKWRQLIL